MLKKIIPAFLVLAMLFSACGREGESLDTYEIDGYSTGFFEGKAVLYSLFDGKLVPEDSVMVKKSRFKFKKHKVEHPQLMFLVFGENEAMVELFVENRRMRLNVDVNKPENTELSGSETHEIYAKFLDNNSVFSSKIQELDIEISNSTGDSVLTKDLENERNALMNEQKKFMVNYVKDNPDSYVSGHVILASLSAELSADSLQMMYEHLSANLKNSRYGKDINAKIAVKKRVAVGVQAPDFTLPDNKGRAVSLVSKQGKKIVIQFWASWCGICRTETPELRKIYAEADSTRLEIITIAAESDFNRWLKVTNADGMAWTQLSDLKGMDSEIFKQYDIRQLPAYFLLDENGRITAKSDDVKEVLQHLP